MRIGIDIGGTKIEAIALEASGKIVIRRRLVTPLNDYQGIVDIVKTLVCGIENETGERSSVGIGIPGAISPGNGRIKNANTVCLTGRQFKQDISATLGREVRVANDANCMAVSEAVDGAAAGVGVVFGVILGTGTGGGLVIGGKPLIGVNSIAGEWGHNPLPWPRHQEMPGPLCYCGNRGCVETFLSGPGLAADFARCGGAVLSPPEIVALAERGEGLAEEVMARYEDRLARGLSAVINIVDPEVIVLGGGLSNVGRLYTNIPRLWKRYIFSDSIFTRLEKARHGDSSGVRGAAWLWPP